MDNIFDEMADKHLEKSDNPQPKEDPKKPDFKGVFKQHSDAQSDRMTGKNKKSPGEVLEEAAKGFNNSQLGTNQSNVDKELAESEKFSKEDLELAEQLIFKSYAELEVSLPQFPKQKFTICTINSEEMAMIDEVILKRIKDTDNDGEHTISDNALQMLRSNAFTAMSYRGLNKKELCSDPLCQLNSIKQGVIAYNSLLTEGKIKEAKETRDELIKNIRVRIREVSRLSVQVLDFLMNERVEFDKKMSRLMNTEGLIPKS